MQMIKDFILMVILPVVCVAIAIFTPMIWLDVLSCQTYSEMTGRKTQYAMLTCYVETAEGRMVPGGEFNMRAITNEK